MESLLGARSFASRGFTGLTVLHCPEVHKKKKKRKKKKKESSVELFKSLPANILPIDFLLVSFQNSEIASCRLCSSSPLSFQLRNSDDCYTRVGRHTSIHYRNCTWSKCDNRDCCNTHLPCTAVAYFNSPNWALVHLVSGKA